MLAYIIPGTNKDTVHQHPGFRRLQAAWPRWHRRDAAEGSLVSPFGFTPPHLSALAEPRATDDGMQYLAPKELPELYTLARTACPENVPVELHCGLTVSIPLATAAPALIVMSPVHGGSFGKQVGAFATLAWELHARAQKGADGPPVTDAEALRLCFLAIQECYHLTEELFTDLGVFRSTDVAPTLRAIWGADPKASGDAGATSPASPQESSPNPA